MNCIILGVSSNFKEWIGLLIAICDDEPILCKTLKNELYTYFNKHNIDSVVEIYNDGYSLLNSKLKFDLIFLDYQMPKVNGLQTAKQIREENSLCTIMFLTSFPEIVYDTFKYGTFRFLIKPLDSETLFEALDSFRKKMNFFYPISLSVDGSVYKVETKDIIYVEARGKNSIIRLRENSLHYPKTLANVYSLLPKHCFFKTHRSFIVNLAYVEKYDSKCIKFTNGEYAKISRDIFPGFKKALNIYLNDSMI